jgi:uncharacterized protein (TIGR00730 family)
LRICIFAGSRSGAGTFRDAAAELGRALAARSIGVVFGGGAIGLMGAVADAALAAGGEVIGVIPEFLCHSEIPHKSLTQLRVTQSMHERKQQMAELSDAYIALPGGIGTLEETFEAWTWLQLGIQRKPIGLLNVAGFYDGLERFLDDVTASGFLSQATRADLHSAENPASLIDTLVALTRSGEDDHVSERS